MIFVKKTTVFLLACLLILSPATGFFVAQASPAAASIAAKRGDTVRISFTAVNETPVFVRGFGLDFRDAYDTDAFEWVSGSWGETITENALLVSVNPESEAVFGAKEEIAISGEVFVLVLRVKETAPLASYPIALSLRQGGGCVLSTATVTVHECEASETVCYDGESHWNPCRTASCTARFNEGAHDFSADGWNADVHWKKCSVCGLADEDSIPVGR